MSTVIPLSKPVMHGDTEINSLELREPTVADVSELGYPFRNAADGGAVEMLPGVAVKYAARLSGVPPSVIKSIALRDLMTLQLEIMGFFGAEA